MESPDLSPIGEKLPNVNIAELAAAIKQKVKKGFVGQGSKFKKSGEYGSEDKIFKAYEELEAVLEDVILIAESDSEMKDIKISSSKIEYLSKTFYFYANQIKVAMDYGEDVSIPKEVAKQGMLDYLKMNAIKK